MADSLIYLDNHATTRTDPRVVEAMLPYFSTDYGNSGSVSHALGHQAKEAVEAARESIAQSIGAEPNEIVFTSGATESNNLAIRGVAERSRCRGNHLVTAKTEHHAVLDPFLQLQKKERKLTLLDVEQRGSPTAGLVDPGQLAHEIHDQTCLVSMMLANNEIGIKQPMAEIAKACHEQGTLLHSDATQAVGKMPIDVRQLDVDLMSFTAHKIYGPKGIGALYVRARNPIVRLDPLVTGGGQERGRRSGTLNVPGIVGFAKAIELCHSEIETEAIRQAKLRDQLYDSLRSKLPQIELCGPALQAVDSQGQPMRLAGNLNIHIPGLDGEAVLMRTPHLAASSSAACSSADPEPSHVLRALGYSTDEARCALRLGFGRFTTFEEVANASEQIVQAVVELTEA